MRVNLVLSLRGKLTVSYCVTDGILRASALVGDLNASRDGIGEDSRLILQKVDLI